MVRSEPKIKSENLKMEYCEIWNRKFEIYNGGLLP
jgi:hypothetical protein